MYRQLAAFLIPVLVSTFSFAQDPRPAELCSQERSKAHSRAKTTVASPEEDAYDISHVAFNLNMTNTSASISGDVTTTARVIAASMNNYVFELNEQLIIDSIKVNGQLLSHTDSSFLRRVALPASLQQNDPFLAQVFYHGQFANGSGFFAGGLMNDVSPTWGTQVTYTLSEPYQARDWWPCKQSLTDKIDSADIHITVPSNLKAGSNGLLQQVVPSGGSHSRYEWETHYPTDYYLFSVSVAPYIDYSYYVHFNGGDSMLVQNYVYDNPQTLPFFQSRIDSIGIMLTWLSDLYGRYPFWQEKYGNCMAPLNGGMEHQTMSTQGNFNTTLSVHELGHQWFGDHVTCSSWKDIWLNEAFASYTEYLYVHHFWGVQQGFNYMAGVHDHVMDEPGGSLYVNDTTDVDLIFSSRLSYDKGSSVVHMLRFLINNDVLFFNLLRTYQQQFAFSTANTEDFKQLAEQTTGLDLDTFFTQWIYGEGFPFYSGAWNQVGNQVILRLDQATTVPSSIAAFATPVTLRLRSSQGDTTVRVYHDQASQLYSFSFSKPVQQVLIDPDDWLINGTGAMVKDATLGTDDIQLDQVKVYPNPTNTSWNASGIPAGSQVQLMDINGRVIWKAYTEQKGPVSIPAQQLPPGLYLLRLSNNQSVSSLKLIKQ